MTVQTKAPESQFAYVVLAARRARQIMAGAPPMVENLRTQKATRIACEEVNHGLIEYETSKKRGGHIRYRRRRDTCSGTAADIAATSRSGTVMKRP